MTRHGVSVTVLTGWIACFVGCGASTDPVPYQAPPEFVASSPDGVLEASVDVEPIDICSNHYPGEDCPLAKQHFLKIKERGVEIEGLIMFDDHRDHCRLVGIDWIDSTIVLRRLAFDGTAHDLLYDVPRREFRENQKAGTGVRSRHVDNDEAVQGAAAD